MYWRAPHPAESSANEPGGYYGVQIIAADEAGNETEINQEDGTWGSQLQLTAYESVKPTATITYPSADSRINTCTRPSPPNCETTIAALTPPS